MELQEAVTIIGNVCDSFQADGKTHRVIRNAWGTIIGALQAPARVGGNGTEATLSEQPQEGAIEPGEGVQTGDG